VYDALKILIQIKIARLQAAVDTLRETGMADGIVMPWQRDLDASR